MKKFKFDFVVTEQSPQQADKRMAALTAISNAFSTEELEKIKKILHSPVQLAYLKSQL